MHVLFILLAQNHLVFANNMRLSAKMVVYNSPKHVAEVGYVLEIKCELSWNIKKRLM